MAPPGMAAIAAQGCGSDDHHRAMAVDSAATAGGAPMTFCDPAAKACRAPGVSVRQYTKGQPPPPCRIAPRADDIAPGALVRQ